MQIADRKEWRALAVRPDAGVVPVLGLDASTSSLPSGHGCTQALRFTLAAVFVKRKPRHVGWKGDATLGENHSCRIRCPGADCGVPPKGPPPPSPGVMEFVKEIKMEPGNRGRILYFCWFFVFFFSSLFFLLPYFV